MGEISQILNQLVDHQHRGPIHSPDELGAGAARTRPNPTLLSPIVSLSLLGNHEEDFRTGLSGRGEDSFFILYRGELL